MSFAGAIRLIKAALSAVFVLFNVVCCLAQGSALSALPSGGLVLSTDLFYDVRTPGVGGVKVTGGQIAGFIFGEVSGDCSLTGLGAITCTKTNGTPFMAGATSSLSGNTTKLATVSGTLTNGHCAGWDANGNAVDEGGPCTTSGGGGTVTAGTANQFAFYPGSAATVSGNANLSDNGAAILFGEGQLLSLFNPNVGGDPNNHIALSWTCGTDSTVTNSDFSEENCIELSLNGVNGQNLFGGGTNAKRTFLALNTIGTYNGSGQRNLYGNNITCFGMGDCSIGQSFVQYAGGDISGDEGQGFTLVNLIDQQPFLVITTISTVTRTTCNTTFTQNVTGSPTPQTVTVASTTGCHANDWVVTHDEVPTGSPNEAAVQITSVGSGTLTGIFPANDSNGDTITPALVLTAPSTFQSGQDRVLLDRSGTTYSTGTIASTTGGTLVGSGTTWTTGMVGGSGNNIGCIEQDADTYTGSPFNGSDGTSTGPLRSWYQITSVTDTTHLGIFSFSTAGDTSYRGKGGGGSTYKIQPCAKILRVMNTPGTSGVSGQLILETSAATWTVGDTIETVISPYPDTSTFTYHLVGYTPGGNYRTAMNFVNQGARTYQAGIALSGNMPVGGGADTVAWGVGFEVTSAQTGFAIQGPITSAAISLGSSFSSGSCTDACGNISWGAQDLTPNSANFGMDFIMVASGVSPNKGLLQAKNASNFALLTWDGSFGTTAAAFSALPACTSGTEGLTRSVKDSTTATWGATIAGGNGNHVLAYCDGTNWTVAAS